MITSISIENFKGIGERVDIPIKPITLLFGANSAGKSTILHALHYAREIFERHNLDPDRTIGGGYFVDLGGFENFVHRHDVRRGVILKFELDLSGRELPDYVPNRDDLLARSPETIIDVSGIKTASVEVSVGRYLQDYLAVEHYAVEIDGEALAMIFFTPDEFRVRLGRINTQHPIFRQGASANLLPVPEWSWFRVHYDALFGTPGDREPQIPISGQADALPVWGRPLGMRLPNVGDAATSETLFPQKMEHDPEEVLNAAVLLQSTLSQLVVGPGELLRESLSEMRYLGPLREIPTRTHQPPRYADPARWASGLGAWDTIMERQPVLDTCNAWLADANRLATGYRIVNKRFGELTPELRKMLDTFISDTFDQDIDNVSDHVQNILDNLEQSNRVVIEDCRTLLELQAQDLGVGIAQLVPVVVAGVDPIAGLTLIEQPELHLHPGMQVRLAELFIDRAHRLAGPVLLETHSEHILLRLLRRIREKSEDELPLGHLGLYPEQLSVVFVERRDGKVVAYPLRIDETGEFRDQWPDGFFEERAEELF